MSVFVGELFCCNAVSPAHCTQLLNIHAKVYFFSVQATNIYNNSHTAHYFGFLAVHIRYLFCTSAKMDIKNTQVMSFCPYNYRFSVDEQHSRSAIFVHFSVRSLSLQMKNPDNENTSYHSQIFIKSKRSFPWKPMILL